MSGFKGWLHGFRGPRTRRYEHVSAAGRAVPRAAPHRLPVRHPFTLLALAAGISLFTVILLQNYGRLGWRRLLGTVLLVGLLNTLFALYLLRCHRETLRSRARVALVGILTVIVLGLAAMHTPGGADWPPYLLPISAATIVFAVVFNRRFSFEASWLLLLYTGIILLTGRRASGEEVVRTLIVLGAGVMTATVATGRIRTRSKVLAVGAWIGVAHAIAILGCHLMWPPAVAAPILNQLLWGLAHGILIGFVISGSLPFVEHLFGVSTDLSLLELSNIAQQTVLRRLLLAAPGTYNHSFVVGMLAEEAAEAIGANPLLARVGGYYHDIGKMLKPRYFGENEVVPGQSHRPLSPTLSTLIIKAHVKDGVELGRHHDLPKPIVDIIRQHHGTTRVEYFYRKAKKRAKEGERVEESAFRYDGPKPQTREAGIVMLADSVEAATRSHSEPSPARIEATIRAISTGKLNDHQLDRCGLTLRDVRSIEDSFIRVLAEISTSARDTRIAPGRPEPPLPRSDHGTDRADRSTDHRAGRPAPR